MNTLPTFEKSRWPRPLAAAAGLLVTLLGVGCAGAAPVATPGGAQPAPVAAVDLVYQEVPYSFVNPSPNLLKTASDSPCAYDGPH